MKRNFNQVYDNFQVFNRLLKSCYLYLCVGEIKTLSRKNTGTIFFSLGEVNKEKRISFGILSA